MSIARAFVAHLDGLHSAGLSDPALFPSRLASRCAAVLPVAGVGVSVFGPGGHRVPVGASSEPAANAERLQFTTGEGPCLTAAHVGHTTLATEAVLARQWPQFHDRLYEETPYRAVTAIPIAAGREVWASVDLFFDGDIDLHQLSLTSATAVVGMMGASLLATITEDGAAWLDNPAATARQDLMVALGILNVALHVTTEQALDVLRARAYSSNSTVDALAADIIHRRLATDDLQLSSNA